VVGVKSNAKFNSAEFTGNSAAVGGGALLVLDSTGITANSATISKNEAPVCGGVAVTGSGVASFFASEITGNGDTDGSTPFMGGGICVTESATANLVASKVTDNVGGDAFIGGPDATLAVFSACKAGTQYNTAPPMKCGTAPGDDAPELSYSYTGPLGGLPSPGVATTDCGESYAADLTGNYVSIGGSEPDLCGTCEENACCGATACTERAAADCTDFEREICENQNIVIGGN
jgi:predicted outer membrane repeat protein